MVPGHILQIFLRVAVQAQIGIVQRVIVDEIIQLRPLRHGHIQHILDPGAIDGNFSSILLRSDGFPTLHIGKQMVVPKDRFLQWITDSVNG